MKYGLSPLKRQDNVSRKQEDLPSSGADLLEMNAYPKMSATEAITELRKRRKGSLERHVQEAFVQLYADTLWSRYNGMLVRFVRKFLSCSYFVIVMLHRCLLFSERMSVVAADTKNA